MLSQVRSCLRFVQTVIFMGVFSNEPEKATNLSKEVWGVIDFQVWKCDCECICHASKTSLFSYFRSLGREDPWRRKWRPTPVLLPGKYHGQRSLVGYSPWGLKESDTTEPHHFFTLFLSYCVSTWWLQLNTSSVSSVWEIALFFDLEYDTVSVCNEITTW